MVVYSTQYSTWYSTQYSTRGWVTRVQFIKFMTRLRLRLGLDLAIFALTTNLKSRPASPKFDFSDLVSQIFGEDRSLVSSGDDEEDVGLGIALIHNPPHNDYNPGGTNTLYTIFLIVNAALGAGNSLTFQD